MCASISLFTKRNNLISFESTLEPAEFNNKNELERILDNFPKSALINDNPDTAPSKRLMKLIEGYNKIVYGAILAENIGMHNLRQKSPRFNEWITKLESIWYGIKPYTFAIAIAGT